jgi:hypothetical protein
MYRKSMLFSDMVFAVLAIQGPENREKAQITKKIS